MKKLFLMVAVCCVIFVSCGKKAETPVASEEPVKQECCKMSDQEKAMFENWNNWANLTQENQVSLVAEMKAFFDAKMAKHEGEGCHKTEAKKEGCAEDQAKKAECEQKHADFKAKWDNWGNLTLDEQKALLDEMIACKKKCHKTEGACSGNHEGCSGNHEGCSGNHEGCSGNHEGCSGNHEGCQNKH